MADKTTITKEAPADVIEQDIAETRLDIRHTLGEIEERLSRKHWTAVLGEKMREKVAAAASRAKELAGKARESSGRLARATRDGSFKAIKRADQFIRENPAAARVIAFEAGVLAVTFAQVLLQRARIGGEPGYGYAKAKIFSIEDVERKVKKASLEPEREFKKAA